MIAQKYLCPPRLQKKFLLWWWTVPELIGIALGAVLVFYLRSPQIFMLTCFLALGTARFDFENNLFGALKMRTAYQLFTKTFSLNVATSKEEKRQKKKLRKLMKSKLPIQELLQFRFGDSGVYGGRDGKELFRFYRYYPPNTDVMTDEEIAQEIEQLCRLFDSLRCPFVMFGTDKVEDMSALKAYYRSQPRQYDHIIADVINDIESTEARSSAVQRAYYFIYKAQTDDDDIYNLIAGKGYKIDRVKNEELAVLLRNYLVREFTNVDLYTIAEEVKNYPDMAKAKPAIYNKEIMRRLCPNRIDFTKDHAEQSGVLRRTLMIKNFPAQIPPRALYTVASMEDAARQAGLTVQRDQDKPGAAYFDADQNVIHVSDAGSEEDVRLSELKGYADAVIQRTATVEQPVRDLESASLAVMLAARYDVGVSDRLSQQLASAHAEAVKCPTFDLPVTLQRLDKALDYCDHFLAHEQERALEQEAENEPEPEQVTELSPQSQAFMMDL